MFRTAICIAAICATTGCASRSGGAPIKPVGPTVQAQGAAQADSLEGFMSKVRARSAMARPRTTRELTVEARDVAITAALITVKARPTAANHRAVAAHYLRLGIKDAAHEPGADLRYMAVLLQPLAGDVEGQVGGVNDAFEEAQVPGKQVGAVLHDHDTLGIELQAIFRRVVVQIERRPGRNEHEALELEAALGFEGHGLQRCFPVVGDVLVELGVFFRRHV